MAIQSMEPPDDAKRRGGRVLYPLAVGPRSGMVLGLAAVIGCGGASSQTRSGVEPEVQPGEVALDAPEARALVGAWYRVLEAQQPESTEDAAARRASLRTSLLELQEAGHAFGDDTLVEELDAETARVVATLDRGASVPIAKLGSSVSHALARHPHGECGIGRLRAYESWDLATLAAMFKADNTGESLTRTVAEARAVMAGGDTGPLLFATLRLSSACFLLSVPCPGLDDALDEFGAANDDAATAAAAEHALTAAEAALPQLTRELPDTDDQASYGAAAERARELAGAWRSAPTEALRATEAVRAQGIPRDPRFTEALARSAGAGKSCGIAHSLPTTQAEPE